MHQGIDRLFVEGKSFGLVLVFPIVGSLFADNHAWYDDDERDISCLNRDFDRRVHHSWKFHVPV